MSDFLPVGTIAVETAIQRSVLGMAHDELTELTAFSGKFPYVALATSIEEHVRLLERVERDVPRFTGAFTLVNGPINPAVSARYPLNKWVRADNGRVGDAEITTRRAVYIDIDPVRPKGISATHDEQDAARDVCWDIQHFLDDHKIQRDARGCGTSGNGFYIVIAIEPVPHDPQQTAQIGMLLKKLNERFGTDKVQIDSTVANPARLMPAAGTMKRKGQDTVDRPHRRVSFCSALGDSRVSLEQLL